MNQKELDKTFMMIFNLIKPFGLHGLYKKYSALQGLNPFINNSKLDVSNKPQLNLELKWVKNPQFVSTLTMLNYFMKTLETKGLLSI